MGKVQLIENWLYTIGDLIKQRIREGLCVEVKTSLSDVVTNVDKEVEQQFKLLIAQHFSTHVVLGEESYNNTPKQLFEQAEQLWVIDPIDGTLNFVKEQKNFVVMIAYYEKGVGQLAFMYDVMANALYIAKTGEGVFKNGVRCETPTNLPLEQSVISISSNFFFQTTVDATQTLKRVQSLRMIGSSGMAMLAVINNHFHGYIALRLQPWDYMAGIIFAQELGICYTTLMNTPLPYLQPTTLVYGTPLVHNTIVSTVNIKK